MGIGIIAGIYEVVAAVVEDDGNVTTSKTTALETGIHTSHGGIDQFLRCIDVVLGDIEFRVLVQEFIAAGCQRQD